MAAFVVDRMNALKGRGVNSGEWHWDELMLCDCVQAQATVRYDVKVIEGRGDDEDTITIRHPICTEAIVFDDFGDEIALEDADKQSLKTAVLEAFMWNMDAVIEFERQLRFVVPVRCSGSIDPIGVPRGTLQRHRTNGSEGIAPHPKRNGGNP